jgi:pimeloyl-ACP methyl ester carboxylesterase
MLPAPFTAIYRGVGLADPDSVPAAEVRAHLALLRREDGGRAFLRIMRGFELTEAKQRFFFEGLGGRPYPAQVVWGERDRMLPPARRRAVQRALGVERSLMLDGKHFLQEDRAPEVAEAIEALSSQVGERG